MDYRKEYKCQCCCYPENWECENSNKCDDNKSEKDNCEKRHNNCCCCEEKWNDSQNKNDNSRKDSKNYEDDYSKDYRDDNKSRDCHCKNDDKEEHEKKTCRRNGCCFCNLFRFHC